MSFTSIQADVSRAGVPAAAQFQVNTVTTTTSASPTSRGRQRPLRRGLDQRRIGRFRHRGDSIRGGSRRAGRADRPVPGQQLHPADQSKPSVAMDRGNFVVAWESYSSPGTAASSQRPGPPLRQRRAAQGNQFPGQHLTRRPVATDVTLDGTGRFVVAGRATRPPATPISRASRHSATPPAGRRRPSSRSTC